MPLAAFQIGIQKSSQIDEENGIIKGCILAELGKLARFADKDGNAKEILVTPEIVDDLCSLGKECGTVQAYWTHDRMNPDNQDKDPAHDGVGFWSNFSKDDSGNLIGDSSLEEGNEYRKRILWRAKNDPKGLMVSLVFDYTGGTNDARATKLYSGDFVKQGAATTALLAMWSARLSEPNPKNNTMEISDLIQMLKDPQCQDAVKAIIKSHNSTESDENPAVMDDVEAAAMEDASGVTAEDKKDEDKDKPAIMRVMLRQGRALARLAKKEFTLSESEKTALLKLAEAEFVKNVGTGAVQLNLGANGPKTATAAWTVKVESLKADHKTNAAAVAARVFPNEYAAFRKEQTSAK